MQLMFEKYEAPAIFMGKDAVLSTFASARSTAMVVDVGHNQTTLSGERDDGCVIVRTERLCRCRKHCRMVSMRGKGVGIGYPTLDAAETSASPIFGALYFRLFRCPSSSAPASAFAPQRTSRQRSAAVLDGFLLRGSVLRSPLAGKLLTEVVGKAVAHKGATIKTRFEFRRIHDNAGGFTLQVTARAVEASPPSFCRFPFSCVSIRKRAMRISCCLSSTPPSRPSTHPMRPTCTAQCADNSNSG